jgi:hypothetical protein
MMATDNSNLLRKFWGLVDDLDWARNERLIDVVPELKQILKYKVDDEGNFVDQPVPRMQRQK